MQSRNRQRCREQTYGHQEKSGGMNWEIGIDVYTLLCMRWVTNENLLYGLALTSLGLIVSLNWGSFLLQSLATLFEVLFWTAVGWAECSWELMP